MDIGFRGEATSNEWYERHCSNRTKVKVKVGGKTYTGLMLAHFPVQGKLVINSHGQPIEFETKYIKSIEALALGEGSAAGRHR